MQSFTDTCIADSNLYNWITEKMLEFSLTVSAALQATFWLCYLSNLPILSAA